MSLYGDKSFSWIEAGEGQVKDRKENSEKKIPGIEKQAFFLRE